MNNLPILILNHETPFLSSAASYCIILANSQKVCHEKALPFSSVAVFPPGFGYSNTLRFNPLECCKML